MGYSELAVLNADNLKKIRRFSSAKGPHELAGIAPSLITMDLTWNCNYNCVGCIDSIARDGSQVVRKHQGGDILSPNPNCCSGQLLPLEYVQSILAYAANDKNGVRGIQIMGGEALMYPHIDEVLHLCSEKRIRCELVTNGSLIHAHIPSLVKAFSTRGSQLRVSINGLSSYKSRIGSPELVGNPLEQVFSGINELCRAFKARKVDSPPILVTTVAFEDVIDEVPEIAFRVASVGVEQMFIIRPRDAQSKRLPKFAPDFRAKLAQVADHATKRAQTVNVRFEAILSQNILVEPNSQPKTYQPCPCAFFKALVGADGWLYICSDQRGDKSARSANMATHNGDFKQTWESIERVYKTTGYSPLASCDDLLCLRHEANVKLHALRCYKQWNDVAIMEIRSRQQAPWRF